jgi:hypothetical protein
MVVFKVKNALVERAKISENGKPETTFLLF